MFLRQIFFNHSLQVAPTPLATNKMAFSANFHPRNQFEIIVTVVSIPEENIL